MKKTDFIKIMDKAIEYTIEHYKRNYNHSQFTCLNLKCAKRDVTKQKYCDSSISDKYQEMFGVSIMTTFEMMGNFQNNELKNTRLVALELYKQVMLDTGSYKKLD